MKERKQLYCCSSYYQLLVSLMKAMTQEQRIDLVLEKHGMETAETLAERLQARMGGLVDQVFVCPDSARVDPYVQRCASFVPWQRREILGHMRQVFHGMQIRQQEPYQEIHVFWDLGYAGTYFNILGIHYTLHEDSLNSYQHIRANRKHYSYIFHRRGWKFLLKKYFHAGVIPFGYSHCCDVVEVNSIEGIEIPTDKVRECPRAALEASLTGEQKREIFQLFLGEARAGLTACDQAVLILTEPFALTGRVPSESAQVRLYEDVIKNYGEGRPVLIKAHPRDTMDYRRHFPQAQILERNVPMEVLNFDEEFRIFRAVTVTSSAVQGIRCAREKLYLGPEFLAGYAAGDPCS